MTNRGSTSERAKNRKRAGNDQKQPSRDRRFHCVRRGPCAATNENRVKGVPTCHQTSRRRTRLLPGKNTASHRGNCSWQAAGSLKVTLRCYAQFINRTAEVTRRNVWLQCNTPGRRIYPSPHEQIFHHRYTSMCVAPMKSVSS